MRKRLVVLHVALFACLFFLAESCRSPIGGGGTSLALSIVLPEDTKTNLPVSLRQAIEKDWFSLDDQSSRFIHPRGTRISVSLTVDGIEGETRVIESFTPTNLDVIRFENIPVGSTCSISVWLSDSGGLLCSGSSQGFILVSGMNNVSIPLKPIVSEILYPGPFGNMDGEGHTFGATIDAASANSVKVFSVSLLKAGPYFLRFSDYDIPRFPTLYDADGRPVATESLSLMLKSFSVKKAGIYYAVVEVPADYSFDAELSVDADTRVYFSGPRVFVDETTGSIMDRQRSFDLEIPCGFSTTPVVQGAQQLPVSNYASGSSITVTPGASGLNPTINGTSSMSVYYTDALLGQLRSSITVEAMPSPRTVRYVHSSGSGPLDSTASVYTSLSSVSTAISGGAVAEVVLLGDGDTIDESGLTSGINLPVGAMFVGGCNISWSRAINHKGLSSVMLPALSQSLLSFVPASPAAFLVDSIDFDIAHIAVAGSALSAISIGAACGDVTLRNSSFRFVGFRNDYGSTATVSLLDIQSAAGLVLDRVDISAANSTDNGTEMDMYGIRSSSNMTGVTIANSFVSVGSVSASISTSETFGVYIQYYGTPVRIVGSTVSAGVYSNLVANLSSSAIYVPSTSLVLTNNIIVIDTRVQNNWAWRVNSARLGFLRNNCIATVSSIDLSSERFLQRTDNLSEYLWTTFQSSVPSASTNTCQSLSSLSLSYGDPLATNYLRPTASSPSSLREGGADLSSDTVLGGLGLSISLKPMFVRDRSGADRTGNGGQGYSVGAYEVD